MAIKRNRYEIPGSVVFEIEVHAKRLLDAVVGRLPREHPGAPEIFTKTTDVTAAPSGKQAPLQITHIRL